MKSPEWAAVAGWLGVAGTILQLVGGVVTLWRLLSAAPDWLRQVAALVGALWRSEATETAAALSSLNEEDGVRVLQGLALLALGYALALASQVWLLCLQGG